MKRIVLVIALLLLVVGVPLAVAAQDSKAVWDLSESIKINDLGIGMKVNYPAGWVYTATETNGVFLAENKDDLAAVSDNDPATLAKTATIQLIGTKTEKLKDALGDKGTLDTLADLLVKSRGITEKEARVEIPVMTRRSVNVLGEDDAKQGWIPTLWHQGDFYVGAFLTTPSDDETLKIAYSWGQLIGSITPLNDVALGEKTIALPETHNQINYPDGWFTSTDLPNAVYELESDITDKKSDGFVIVANEIPLASAKLDETATIDDLVKALVATGDLKEPVVREEYILLGKPAVTIRGPISSGQFVLSTQTIIDGFIVQIAVVGASEEKVSAFEPTFIAILQSLKAVKAS